jgi:hypothetical protein
MNYDTLFIVMNDLYDKSEKAAFSDFTINVYNMVMILYNPTLGKIRFNEICEGLITLKEELGEDNKMISRTECIKKVKNNKVDLFSKFIGLDKRPLGCDIVLLYLDMLASMKDKQFISVVTKNQSVRLLDLFPVKERIH